MEVSSGYDSHSHGKSPFFIGKPSINGSFSMAMLNNQMVSSTESSSTPGHIRSPRYHQAPAMPGSAFKVLSMPASWLSKPILSCFKRFTMACRSGIPWDTLGYRAMSKTPGSWDTWWWIIRSKSIQYYIIWGLSVLWQIWQSIKLMNLHYKL